MAPVEGFRPVHQPVLLAETMELLAVRPGALYVDGTVGLGGHAAEVLARSAPDGSLVAFDRDPEALRHAAARLAEFGPRVRFEHADFREIPERLGGEAPGGVLLDLGVSSLQLDEARRGFSFSAEGPLDMRMDPSRGFTAADLVNRLPERELADVIYRWGEEHRSRRIARAIVEARRARRLDTTTALAEVVRRAAGRSRRPGLDPATRTFQALRIQVNRELEGLGGALDSIASTLAPGGRLAVIAFHSLEDREVKQAFRGLATRGFRLLTKKPLRPTEEEVRRNPRSRSARLRAIEREMAA
ncbi:MAG TPA: 16S rRNA (cytosine(1402)-N(4))-methyltransferase RsmH [Vicinamibacteria bacterium]|nr:16S rRNA (cytosine(1402)-N(4))-methyltransferase RsmH [Vicinamibacteria bacterium]